MHWYSATQFGFSLLAILTLWGAGLTFSLAGFFVLLDRTASSETPMLMFLLASVAVSCGCLLAPSAGYSLARLVGHRALKSPPWLSGLKFSRLMLLWPVILALGYLVSQEITSAMFFLPALHLLAVGLPVGWALDLMLRGLPPGSPQRGWGIFGSGLALSPLVIMVLEILALLFFVFLGVAFITSQPGLEKELTSLAEWIARNNPPQQAILERLTPYVLRPSVVWMSLAFVAIVVPLIEETIKPIGAWLLLGRNLSAMEGFVAGALSGAGYASFESLVMTRIDVGWVFIVVARVGTTFVHIFTAGLVGWGLAYAWRKKRWGKFFLVYLEAVMLHGLWNGLTILSTLSTLAASVNADVDIFWLVNLGLVGPYGLGFLALGTFLVLILTNHSLATHYRRRQKIALPLPESVP